MDNIGYLRLIFVTIPENILNIYIAFLFTGERLCLPFRDNKTSRKSNIFNLVLTVAIFSLIQILARKISSSMPLFFLINIFFSTIALRIIYRKSYTFKRKDYIFLSNNVNNLNKLNNDTEINYSEEIITFIQSFKIPLIQSLIILLFLFTIEGIYIPPTLNALNIPLNEVFEKKNLIVQILLPQIDRLIQIIIISFMWNFTLVKNNIMRYTDKKSLYLILFLCIIIAELGTVYIDICNFNLMSISSKIFCTIKSILVVVINFLSFKLLIALVENVFKIHKKT